jgi:uncharacterized protein YfkK (UPF0435 family)
MVNFGVVGDDQVNLSRVNYLTDILYQLVLEWFPTVSTRTTFSSITR